MQIIESTPESKIQKLKTPMIVSGFIFTSAGLLLPAVVAVTQSSQPHGTYLSPQPQGLLTSSPDPAPTLGTGEAILTAQAFLEKAITLSQKTPQTEADKKQIVTLLNQSLDYSNQAIVAAPNSPQSYLVRARVLASSASVRPDALELAQQDLNTAQRLSGGQKIDLPTNINLMDLSPNQQAGLDQDIIIAAPGDDKQSSSSADTVSNINKSTATISAGQTEITITDPRITTDSYIYTIANQPGSYVIFVKSKTDKSAIISLDRVAEQPVAFEYWVVNP